MSQPQGQEPSPIARQLRSPVAMGLADLAAIFDDLQFVLGCCERLLTELARGEQRDDVVIESLWGAALLAYTRCFQPGERGLGLSVADLKKTDLQGEVEQWHTALVKMRDLLIGSAANPREEFTVGATQAVSGGVDGIVITSSARPQVDDVTVRQTGRLAFELGKVVNERMKDHQQKVFTSAARLSTTDFDELDPIDVDLSIAQRQDAGAMTP
jgi:hypothetical protein